MHSESKRIILKELLVVISKMLLLSQDQRHQYSIMVLIGLIKYIKQVQKIKELNQKFQILKIFRKKLLRKNSLKKKFLIQMKKCLLNLSQKSLNNKSHRFRLKLIKIRIWMILYHWLNNQMMKIKLQMSLILLNLKKKLKVIFKLSHRWIVENQVFYRNR